MAGELKAKWISKTIIFVILFVFVSNDIYAERFNASEQVESIKRAVKNVFEAALANDADRFAEAFHPGSRQQAEKQLQRMKQIFSMTESLTFSPMIIMYDANEAIVVSKPFKPNRLFFKNDDIVMISSLRKDKEHWKVIQLGANIPNTIPDFYSYWEQQHPETLYWLDSDTPDWLRPQQDLQTDKNVEQLAGISESFRREIAERRRSLIQKVERMAGGMEVFKSYFPASSSGAEKLDKWWPEREEDGQVDKSCLAVIRNGLRVDTQGNPRKNKNEYIKWVAQKFIWRAEVQDPNAVELIYHASFDSKLAYDCVYHGLSTIRPKNRTDKVLKRLTELAMADISTGRIHWGTKGSHESILKHLQPYLDSSDPDISTRAQLLGKVFKGELDYDKWSEEQHRKETNRKFTPFMGQIREILAGGSCKQRRDAFKIIKHNSLSDIFDESFAEPIKVCLQDEDPEVRKMAMDNIGELFGKRGQCSDEILALMDKLSKDPYSTVRGQVAKFIGSNWIWNVQPQNTKAIEILIGLAKDSEHETRHNASYWGLSRIRDPDAIKYLVNFAISEQEKDSDIYKIICWTLKSSSSAKEVIQQFINTETKRKESAIKLYKDTFGEDLQ